MCGLYAYCGILPVRITAMQRAYVAAEAPTYKEAVTYLTAYYLSSQDFPSCSISLRGNCEKCHFHNFVLYS